MRQEREPRRRHGQRQHPTRTERRAALDADQIVQAAMSIADEDGPGAITMRAVAARLGVGVMSLYWHVPTKRELEGLIMQQLMDEAAPPPDPTGDWREDLASIARNARKNMLHHPWMIDLFSSMGVSPELAVGHGLLRHIEHTMRMVEGLPLDFATKMAITSTLDDFTMGFTTDEILDRRRHEAMGMSEEDFRAHIAPHIRELLEEGNYPLFRNYMEHDHELPGTEERFEAALQIIIDGIGVQIERAQQRAGAAPAHAPVTTERKQDA
jgi:AcrR family transcriptional regulator